MQGGCLSPRQSQLACAHAVSSAGHSSGVDLRLPGPLCRCVDIQRISELCHARGAVVCIDGTFATPINMRAIDFGADLVLHSATKYLGGHNDLLAGQRSSPWVSHTLLWAEALGPNWCHFSPKWPRWTPSTS